MKTDGKGQASGNYGLDPVFQLGVSHRIPSEQTHLNIITIHYGDGGCTYFPRRHLSKKWQNKIHADCCELDERDGVIACAIYDLFRYPKGKRGLATMKLIAKVNIGSAEGEVISINELVRILKQIKREYKL